MEWMDCDHVASKGQNTRGARKWQKEERGSRVLWLQQHWHDMNGESISNKRRLMIESFFSSSKGKGNRWIRLLQSLVDEECNVSYIHLKFTSLHQLCVCVHACVCFSQIEKSIARSQNTTTLGEPTEPDNLVFWSVKSIYFLWKYDWTTYIFITLCSFPQSHG